MFHEQEKQINKKIWSTTKSLAPLYKNKDLSLPNRKKIIKNIIVPVALYGAPAWADLCLTKRINIRRKISMAAKNVLNYGIRFPTDALYDQLKIPIAEDFGKDERNKLWLSLKNEKTYIALAESMSLAWPENFVYQPP